MADSINIPIEILTKEAIDEVKKFAKSSQSALKAVSTSTAGTNTAIGKIKGTISGVTNIAKLAGAALVTAFAGRALLSGLSSLIDEATEFENSLIGVRSVASNFGVTANEVTSVVEELASDGLVPVQDVANSLKNLLATGLNIEESKNLFLTLKDAAAFGRQGFLDLGQAIEGASQGIKNGQSTLVDNAGITKNLSVLQKEYAASIGTTVGKLTEAQKKQAVYQGILREGAIFSGDAARLQETYSGATAKLSFSLSKLQVKLGQFITRSPIIVRVVSLAADAFNKLTQIINDNASAISEGIKKGVSTAIESFQFLVDGVDFVARTFDAAGKLIVGVFSVAIEKVLSIIDFGIDKFNKFAEFAGLETRIPSLADKIKSFSSIASQAFEDLSDSFIEETKLQNISNGLASINTEIKSLGSVASLDSLNKQVKQVSESTEVVNETFKESVQVIERLGSRFSTVSASVTQSLGQIGQSAESAFSFAFGTGADKQKAELDQLEKDLQKAFDAAEISPETYEAKKKELKKLKEKLSDNTSLGITTGIANSLAKGGEGAKELVTGLTKGFLDTIIPGLGQALGPLINAFAKGPEEVKKLVTEFAQALPVIVENIILSIPAFIEAIADNLDVIIIGIVDRIDEIIIALVRAMPRVASKLAFAVAFEVPFQLIKTFPSVAWELAKQFILVFPNAFKTGFKKVFGDLDIIGLFRNLGKLIYNGFWSLIRNITSWIFNLGKTIYNGFWDGIKSIGDFFYNLGKAIVKGFLDGLDSVGDFVGDAAQSIGLPGGQGGITGSETVDTVLTGGLNQVIGFARGGLIPKGFPGDSFPARLTSGEYVVDRSTTKDLQDFLSMQSNGNNNGNETVINLLSQIANLLQTNQTVESTVDFNGETLANIILNLNRNNARLA